MKTLDSREAIEEAVKADEMVLVYFGSVNCGVCVDLKPKVKALLEMYPKIKSIYVDMEKSHKIGVYYNFFTMPGLLLFIQGKETLREARHISIDDLDMKISRYYDMIFG